MQRKSFCKKRKTGEMTHTKIIIDLRSMEPEDPSSSSSLLDPVSTNYHCYYPMEQNGEQQVNSQNVISGTFLSLFILIDLIRFYSDLYS